MPSSPVIPTIQNLPPPPAGRTGWPWTEAPPPLPPAAPGGGAWPRISIVVPSFNQGRYIEETIRSVLLQGYPDFELIIMDGGSTDESVEVIRKYEPWLSSWVSEPDEGQSDAINKGFARISGEVFNWLCSDDLLVPGAFEKVGEAFLDKTCGVFSGACLCQYDDEPQRNEVRPPAGADWQEVPYTRGIWQASTFWRPELVRRRELVRRDLHFVMDRELWCHLVTTGASWRWSNECLSVFRFTADNKSVVGKRRIVDEISRIYGEYVREALPLSRFLVSAWLPLVMASKPPSHHLLRLPAGLIAKMLGGLALLCYPAHRVRALQREFYSYTAW